MVHQMNELFLYGNERKKRVLLIWALQFVRWRNEVRGAFVLVGWVQETDLLEKCLKNGVHIIALCAAEDQSISLLPEPRRPSVSHE